jgi:hypothetical protein
MIQKELQEIVAFFLTQVSQRDDTEIHEVLNTNFTDLHKIITHILSS